MILDAKLLFSDSQDLGATSPVDSTNSVDFGVAGGIDAGTGQDLYLVTVIDVVFVGAVTMTVSLEGDSTTTFTPDGIEAQYVIPATAAAGSVYFAKLNPGSAALQYRYLQVSYTSSGADLTSGEATTFITTDIDKYKAYANGYTITG